jgi:hypothetical protein
VFDDIRAARGTDYVNDFWRAMAHDPPAMGAVGAAEGGGAGRIGPLGQGDDLCRVSTANGCQYCIHSHTAGAKAKGMSPEMHVLP